MRPRSRFKNKTVNTPSYNCWSIFSPAHNAASFATASSMQGKIVIAMVAGEASGDLLGSHLISALKAARSDLEFVGIGGPKMQSAGLQVMFPMEKLAVNGYVDALLHYREIVGIR